MNSLTPIQVPPGEGTRTFVIGNRITIKLHGRNTGGAFALIESVDAPGEGPPPHVHAREDECFFVLEGEYEVFCDGRRIPASAGTTIFAPRGLAHNYRSIGKSRGRLLTTISPAGFEKFFEEINAMPPEHQEIPKVVAIGKKYGLEFLPPT